MTMSAQNFNNNHVGSFSRRQQLFAKYTLAVLIDLTILNLFNEFWEYVRIESFSISLLAAIMLQLMLQATVQVEHKVAAFFKKMSGIKATVLRVLSAWAILFISKLIILEAITFVFAGDLLFGGPVHGVVAFIIVVIALIVAEQIFFRIYRALA